MELIVITSIIPLYFAVNLHKLRLMQEKDYSKTRVFVDRRTYQPQLTESIVIVILLLEILRLSAITNLQDLTFTVFQAGLALSALTVEVNLLRKRIFKRPRPTLRIALIAIIPLALILLLCLLLPSLAITILSLAIILNMFVVVFGNEAAKPIVYTGHRKKFQQASAYLASVPDLKLIGITGSYGKSTTKGFLNTILTEKYKIISTPGSINTDIGLATSIISQFKNTDIAARKGMKFAVLEMDAYVVGTIARITKYFPLDLALITSINEQHLDTFGGEITNTVEGNYQIIEGLKENGDRIAVFNHDNMYTREMASRYRQAGGKEIYLYGKNTDNSDLDVSIIDSTEEITPGKSILSLKLRFSKRLGGEEITLKLPVVGRFNAYNFAAAALIARLYDVSIEEITAAASKVRIKEKTQSIKFLDNGIEIIDDTFNGNPDGIRANIETLAKRNSVLPAKNIVIFTGLFDLGSSSEQIHAEISKKLVHKADLVIVTNPIFAAQMLRDLDEKERKKLVSITDPEEIIGQLKEYLPRGAEVSDQVNLRIMMMNSIPSAVYKYINNL
jgi:UDP-N-acetylmuramoyl-tripeptide--D-alanyl-D-alanine ligase